jgi:hypothetical protein
MVAIANWTDVTNSFELGTAAPYATLAASSNYAQGGPFSSSEIKQEVAIADPYGVAVVTFARANVLATDTGTVILEALNGGGSVITSATTGAVVYATLNVWTRSRLALPLPLGAVTLRIRLLATRTLGSWNSGAAFDDFSLRVFKHLDSQDVLALDFSQVPEQPLPTTWQKFHLAWPDLALPSVLVAGGVLSISSTRSFTGQSIAWSDASIPDAGVCVGAFGSGVTSTPSFVFSRAADVDLQISGGSLERGAFTAAAGFTVRVVGRVDEVGFSSACGVIGRGTSGLGWSMKLDATGHVQAVLRGASGTKTATSTSTVHDGALHAIVMVYSQAASTLRVYVDRRGYNETSTASGLGAFTVATAPVRIGRDLSSSETLPGQIAEVELFETALTEAEIESMWTLGADPTGEIDTYTRAVAAWVDGEADAAGVTLPCMASDQVALGHHAATSTTGLATCQVLTNLVASFDFEAASWTWDGVAIAKTAGVDGYNATASSVESIAADGYVEFRFPTSTKDRTVGLTDVHGTQAQMDFGIYGGFDNNLYTVENGVQSAALTAFVPGTSVIRINKTGSTVTALKDGVLFATFAASSSGALLVDTHFYNVGADVSHLRLYDDGAPVSLTWANQVNVTVTAGADVTHDTRDPTGLARGITILSPNTSAGFRHTGMTVSSVAKIGVTFWARASTGTPTINLRLKSSAAVVKDTVAVVLTTLWKRYDVMFDTWDAATATCHVEWISASGSVTFDLAHVVAVYQPGTLAEAQHPTLIPAAAAGTFASGVYATCTRTMPTQWSAEGEIDVEGVAVTATPPVLAAVVEVGKAATVDNRRIVRVDDNSASPELLLYDGGASLASSSEGTAIDWTVAWRLRGRWNRSKTLDNAANAYGGIVVTGSAASAVYAQNASWTDDTAVIADTILIGADTPDAIRLSAYLSTVTLRTGPKLLP